MSTVQNSALLKLPTELHFRLLEFLYDDWFLDNSLGHGPGGSRPYLGYRHILPNAPWNALSHVCQRLRDVVRSHRTFVTTLHPDLAQQALAHRPDEAPIHVFYSDADTWRGVRGPVRVGSILDIASAAKIALGTLHQAKVLRIDSIIAESPAHSLKTQLLSKVLIALATSQADNLQDLTIHSSRSSPQADIAVKTNANYLWMAHSNRFPKLTHLNLHNIPYTFNAAMFPPPSLIEFTLSNCHIPQGIDGLLEILHRLPRLRKLALSGLALFSRSIAFEKRVRRCIRLQDLQHLSLMDYIPALENIFYHLNFPCTADVEFRSILSPGDGQLDGSETYFRALAQDLQSRMNGTTGMKKLCLSIPRYRPQFSVEATGSGQRLYADFGWRNDSCNGLRTFIGEIRALQGVTELSLTPAMNHGDLFNGQDRADELLALLRRLPNVQTLKIQGDLSHVIWDNLKLSDRHISPRLQALTITDVFSDISFAECVGWGRNGLRIAFVACPGLVDVKWDSPPLQLLMCTMAIDYSGVNEPSEGGPIEGLADDEQPHDDDWGWDEDVEMGGV